MGGKEQQAELDYASKHFVEAIRRATERIELAHEVIRQDYYGSPNVSRDEFTLCAEPFLDRVPSLKVLQWAPLVDRGDRERFQNEARREGWPNYRIIEPDSEGRLVPARQRPEYFPIWYAASKTGFEARFGWDFAADPVLLGAINECRDSAHFVISDAIDLSKVGIHGTMVQTFLPIYDNVQDAKTAANRPSHLRGLLVGLCQVDDLVERALAYASGPQGIDLCSGTSRRRRAIACFIIMLRTCNTRPRLPRRVLEKQPPTSIIREA